MILSSHQPNFLPYMGFFYKAMHSDILVLSEDVAYSKSGMHNWNRIYTQNGVRKLTVPVSAHHDTPLWQVPLVDSAYHMEKIAKTLEHEYKKAPHYTEGMAVVTWMLHETNRYNRSMVNLNEMLIERLLMKFDVNVKIVSSLDLQISGHKDERLFQMCERTGADTYLSGTGAKVYHVQEEYDRRGLRLEYSDYTPIVYPQIHGEFVENLSVIDYVFNCGFSLPASWHENGG